MAKNNLIDPAAEERAKRADMNAGLGAYEQEAAGMGGTLEKEAAAGMDRLAANKINLARLKAFIPLSRASAEERAAYITLYGREKYDADMRRDAEADSLTAQARRNSGR